MNIHRIRQRYLLLLLLFSISCALFFQNKIINASDNDIGFGVSTIDNTSPYKYEIKFCVLNQNGTPVNSVELTYNVLYDLYNKPINNRAVMAYNLGDRGLSIFNHIYIFNYDDSDMINKGLLVNKYKAYGRLITDDKGCATIYVKTNRPVDGYLFRVFIKIPKSQNYNKNVKPIYTINKNFDWQLTDDFIKNQKIGSGTFVRLDSTITVHKFYSFYQEDFGFGNSGVVRQSSKNLFVYENDVSEPEKKFFGGLFDGLLKGLLSPLNAIKKAVENLGIFIINGIKSLFVPSNDSLKKFIDTIFVNFSKKLGFLSQSIDYVFGILKWGLSPTQTCSINLPPISIMGTNFFDIDFNLCQLIKEPFKPLFDIFINFQRVLITTYFISYAYKKYKEFLS